MSRFLDERGRIFGTVNVVDLLVLLVIVAVVVFAVFRTTGDASETFPVEVTYTVQEVRQATVDALLEAVEAQALVRDDGGTELGTVVTVTPHPTLKESLTADGRLESFESPVFSDVDIVLSGHATESRSTVYVGGVPMRVGKKVTLVGTGFEVLTVIIQVRKLPAGQEADE